MWDTSSYLRAGSYQDISLAIWQGWSLSCMSCVVNMLQRFPLPIFCFSPGSKYSALSFSHISLGAYNQTMPPLLAPLLGACCPTSFMTSSTGADRIMVKFISSLFSLLVRITFWWVVMSFPATPFPAFYFFSPTTSTFLLCLSESFPCRPRGDFLCLQVKG